MHPQRPHDIEAEIQAFPTVESGKKSPLFSGYRPNHNFGKNGELNDGHHEYPDEGKIEVGHSGRALIWLLAPERNEGLLEVGGSFTVQEANRIIGRGKITSLPNATLRKNG